ncbi:type II toxin-antitoxin system HicA family toxin [bacterium]|nr:type II toxin-antitoxin system HicA family toxin [bacterium]
MAPKLPRTTAKKILRALKKAGFYVHHQTGSHKILFHESREDLTVVVPDHPGDLKVGTLSSIIKQADLSVDDFINLL